MQTARHQMMLSGGAPEWVHLIPAGTFKGVDGRGPYVLRNPQAVIAASMNSGDELPIDENHATDFAAPAGGQSPARGWIVEMQSRDDGIWGRVRWTQSGLALLQDEAYRSISPVFTHSDDGVVQAVLRAGLTNTPNLSQLHTLHSQETRMDLAALRSALGLPETADEAAILAAATAARQAVAAHAQQITQIATAIGVTGDTSTTAILTALQAQQANASETARMAKTITTLETQVATMRQEQARMAAVAFVDGAIKAGKPINALRDHYITRHMADAAAVETEIAAMVAINVAGGGTAARHAAVDPAGDEPTETEREVAQRMGLDPKKLVKTRKETGADGRMA